MREINQAGIDLIKSFEGIMDGDPSTVNLDPYLDPVGIWTIAWGHAITNKGRFLRGRQDAAKAKLLYPHGITLEDAEAMLRHDVASHALELDKLLKVEVNDNQYAALVSFIFNLGPRNLRRSTLLRLVNERKFREAAGEFRKWNQAGGKVLKGLTRRREAERELFMKPVGG